MHHELSCCPRCFACLGLEGRLASAASQGSSGACPSCGLAFQRRGALLDLLGEAPREEHAAEVERFYQKSPFPGYAPEDDGPRLEGRARRSAFLAALDAALPPDAEVLDAGCGTAQLAAFLALAAPRRRVLAVDGCRASLECAEAFRERAGIANLELVRADLFDLPVRDGRFPYVISRGVVHHTPDPPRATASVARCVAPGGLFVLGFYESVARLPHRARRGLARVVGRPVALLDPILRRRDIDAEKKRIWIEDQYRHPLEHMLPLPEVMRTLRGLGFGWVRSVPPAARGGNLFESTPEPGAAGMHALRAGLALRGLSDPDAGLICVVVRRHRAS